MSCKFFKVIIFTCFLSQYAQGQLAGYKEIDEETLDISFQDDEGKTLTLKDYKGKVVLINLWAPYCAPCVQEMPSFQKLREIFSPEELEIIPICTSLKFKEQARSLFVLGNLDGLKPYFDHQEKIVNSIQSRGIPVTLLFNKQGKLIGKLNGATEWDHFENVQFIDDIVKDRARQKPLKWYEKILVFIKNLI